MKRRPRKSQKPPPARRERGNRPGARAAVLREPGPLLYKVVELSTVDEGSLERCLNHWAGLGWNLDGVQFAMREASKRPAMAFVFFTREGEAETQPRSSDEALAHLQRMAESQEQASAPAPVSAHERLRQLAGEYDEPGQDE
ncbi:MAG: hypothetical protein ACJ790_15470 [Myxococcaceae bacterium]